MPRVEWTWHFEDLAPAQVWSMLADTDRFNEILGLPAYRLEEIAQPNGTVMRRGSGKVAGVELAWEEKDWIKTVWEEDAKGAATDDIPERVRAKPVVMDPRIASRMRRFQLSPEEEARVSQIVVPEEEIEGWTKGHLRQLYRWGMRKAFEKKKLTPLEDKDVD